ncbi:hypothetical protein [Phenylobacterium aquaticum]|uniref:hypothetical protein n=1 Tax=Phenylobacterium aquaticum TaxID=1763816 RepID=UPI001F5DFD4B|nr:hypothetical protein [Phenylobacterium aquaticum]MCI3135025.1 hypothetical protein [Phenylobacterium aquaticum]
MRVRFTSIVWEEVHAVATDALTFLEDRVALRIGSRSYGTGIDEFLGVLVSVDTEDNSRFAKPYNNLGTVMSKEGVKFRQLCLAVELDPEDLTGRTDTELASLFAKGLCERLRTVPARLPKGFDWNSFSVELILALTAE